MITMTFHIHEIPQEHFFLLLDLPQQHNPPLPPRTFSVSSAWAGTTASSSPKRRRQALHEVSSKQHKQQQQPSFVSPSQAASSTEVAPAWLPAIHADPSLPPSIHMAARTHECSGFPSQSEGSIAEAPRQAVCLAAAFLTESPLRVGAQAGSSVL